MQTLNKIQCNSPEDIRDDISCCVVFLFQRVVWHSHWRVQPNERIQINFVFEFWVFKSSNLKFPQQTQTCLHGKLNLLLGVGRTEVICRRRSFSTPWASLAGRRLIVFKCFLTDSIASWLDTCSKDLHKLLLGAPC